MGFWATSWVAPTERNPGASFVQDFSKFEDSTKLRPPSVQLLNNSLTQTVWFKRNSAVQQDSLGKQQAMSLNRFAQFHCLSAETAWPFHGSNDA